MMALTDDGDLIHGLGYVALYAAFGGSETKRGLRRFSGVGGLGVSQEPIAKSPAWCGALSALQPD